MSVPLRALLVDDAASSSALLSEELRRGGFAPEIRRVTTREDFENSLELGAWDVVLSEVSSAGLSAFDALVALKERDLDVPFVVVAETLAEDVAIRALKAGAQDCIPRASLLRLCPILERALREAQIRRERRQAQEALSESELRFRALAESAPDAILIADASGTLLFANRAAERLFGCPVGALIGRPATALVPEYRPQGPQPADAGDRAPTAARGLDAGGNAIDLEVVYGELVRDGRQARHRLRAAPRSGGAGGRHTDAARIRGRLPPRRAAVGRPRARVRPRGRTHHLVRRRRPHPRLRAGRVSADGRRMGEGDPSGRPRARRRQRVAPLRDRRAVLRGVPRADLGRPHAPLAPRGDPPSRRRPARGPQHRHGHRHQRAPPDRGGPARFRAPVPRALRAQPRRRLPLDDRGPPARLQRGLRADLRLCLARGGPAPGGVGLLREARGPRGRPGQAHRTAEPDELRDLPQAQGRQPRLGPPERESRRGLRRPPLRHRGDHDRHLGAQAGRGAGQAPRLPRSADEPAQPPPLQRPPDARRGAGPPAQPAAGRPLSRPRPLQGHQRLARPLGRRRAPAPGGRADPGVRPRGRHRGAPGRRRVHAARPRHQRRGRRRQDRAQDLRSHPRPVLDRRPRALRDDERRRLGLPLRRARRRDPRAQRGLGDVPRQGAGPRQLPALHAGHEREGGRAPLAREPPAPGRRQRRARAALPALHRPAHRRGARRGGPHPLAAPRARPDPPDGLHPHRRALRA